MSKQKTILVTGGAGFIGSHLCKRLLKEGCDVVCADNFFTGSKNNIRNLLKNDHFELIRHDIVQPLYVEIDQIYNLACPASPIYYQHNPIKTIKTSTVGMVNMLGLAKRVKGRILQASTSEIYGDPEMHPQKEDYFGNVNPLGPRACYDEGKRVAESLCMDYHRQNGLDIRIIRIFNTYGPKMGLDDGRVMSNFITQALKNEPLTIYGDGSQTRSFCYIDDLIEAMVRMMDQDEFIGPFNVGNPEEIRVGELADKVIKLTNSRSKIQKFPLPENDPKRRRPDISLVKNKLDWQPEVYLDEGLIKTVEYFRQILR